MTELRFIDPDATADGLRALLAGAVEPTVAAQNARAFPFLAGLGGLGLRGAIDAGFVSATADGVNAVWAGVRSFADDLEALVRDTFVGDEWLQAMERRSALQFLLDAYAQTPLAERFPYLEVGDLDELLRHRGQTEGFLRDEDIPDGVPESHWWWRLP
jgi:hypothetical protein